MAVPKRRTSKARRDKRRSHHALTRPNLVPCPNCGELIEPHRACPFCGFYNGKQILEVETGTEEA